MWLEEDHWQYWNWSYRVKTSERDAIIDDLLCKRPSGPKGVSLTFTSKEEYDYDRSRYRNISVCSDLRYGYSNETLFCLGLHSFSQVTIYIKDRFFPGKTTYQLGIQKRRLALRRRLFHRMNMEHTRLSLRLSLELRSYENITRSFKNN